MSTVERILLVVTPVCAGAATALALTLGLVYAAERPPENNPASQPILTYGE